MSNYIHMVAFVTAVSAAAAKTHVTQDGVIFGETRAGTETGDSDLPIQLGQWQRRGG
ncbi:hypothetical protein PR002_g19777 [Phytophthora rubi]|nr:hypothetical protein PR002_g19777 [Phytophthora rubi]